MYQVSIFNDGIEVVIHRPSADINDPHLLSLPLKESLSKPDELSFTIPVMNPGYPLIQGLKTKVKVYDTRDNSVVFSGRVIPTKENLSNDGKLTKEVTCESALAYLNDTNTRRWNFTNRTPTQILQYLLDAHNAKVDTERQIKLGTIEFTNIISIYMNYETTLNTIISKIRNVLGGDMRVQERNGVLYLDYLKNQGNNKDIEVRLGYNLKDIVREYDPINIITRIVPLGYGEGINQLDITKVNAGVDYLEDAAAISQYGIIEGVVTNKDIQDPNTLKLYAQTRLNESKTPRLTYEQTSLDLSVLPEHENEKYELGDTLHTIIESLAIDTTTRVIERERDLINDPWNVKLTVSTRSTKQSDEITDIKQRNQTLENAPQGSTYIDTFGYAENIDATHRFQLPIWLSPDILNINRVRLHINSQPYRAYERGMESQPSSSVTSAGGGSTSVSSSDGGSTSVSSSAGGGQTKTSTSGGGKTVTSTDGGGETLTSTSGGGKTISSTNGGGQTKTSTDGGGTTSTTGGGGSTSTTTSDGGSTTVTSASGGSTTVTSGSSSKTTSDGYVKPVDVFTGSGMQEDPSDVMGHYHVIAGSEFTHSHGMTHTHSVTTGNHTHNVTLGNHSHGIYLSNHYHNLTLGNHSHSVTIDDHSHDVTVPDHSHDVLIPDHSHNVTVDDHSHNVTVDDHSHNVTIGNHTHNVTIGNHTHDISIPGHKHELQYGIFEDGYPQDVYVLIDGQVVAGPYSYEFNEDIDLSSYVWEPGRTYNLEVTSSTNGRVNVWVSIQAFIQVK